MNQEHPLTDKQPDNMTATNSAAIIPQKQTDKLVIDCDKIVLKDNGIEITLDGNMNYTGLAIIVINGVTFIRVKERDERDERDDRDDPSLQYFGL